MRIRESMLVLKTCRRDPGRTGRPSFSDHAGAVRCCHGWLSPASGKGGSQAETRDRSTVISRARSRGDDMRGLVGGNLRATGQAYRRTDPARNCCRHLELFDSALANCPNLPQAARLRAAPRIDGGAKA